MHPAKLIVITGVSRGLGRALVAEFARMGHTVIGCARSANAIAALRRQYGPPHEFDVINVAVDAQVSAWARRVRANRGVPDLLINNAALINRNAPLWEIGPEEFSLVIDVNVKGVANVIRHFLPAMIKRGTGVVVNVSSGWGRSADAQVAPYCATKWAIEGMTLALAQELPPGLAAVTLNPGVVNTEMLQSCFGAAAQNYPGPAEWAKRAAPFILRLGPGDNGKQLTVPGAPTD